MKKLTIIFTFLVIALTAQVSFAQTQKEKDRASFISNTRLLERKPFDQNADVARQWGFKWVADTDEVSVTLCAEIMKLIPEKKNKYKSELLMQFTFGMALFKLEHPDQKNDEMAAQLAGLESVLRTYEVMLNATDKAKNAELDALLVKRNNNELKAVVEAAQCKK
jgi:carboxypeptidase Q